MPFQIVVLRTDWLVFLLVAVIAVTAVYVSRREHLRAPWKRVFQSPSGMAGLTVLAVFVLIGLADCLHFQARLDGKTPDGKAVYAPEVQSVLDVALAGLRASRERTYSAPLATHLYARETVELPDGRQAREFPRLKHAGTHLDDPGGDRVSDLAHRALAGTAFGVIAILVLATLVCAGIARNRECQLDEAWSALLRGETELPWRAVLATVAVLLLLAGTMFTLGQGYHVLGTGKVGEDVLYQALKSIRTALVIGTLTTLVMLPFAVLFGIAAGYFRGWVDDVIQYVYTTLHSIPGVLLIAASVLMTQVYIDTHPQLFPTAAERADLRLLFLCIILGVTTWTGLCRLLRGETLKVRELEYIQAAHAFGVSHARIIVRHILPNVMHIVLISVVAVS